MTGHFVSIDWGGSELKGIFTGNNREFKLPAGNLRLLGTEKLSQICRDVVAAAQFGDNRVTWLIGAAGAADREAAARLVAAVTTVYANSQEVVIKSDYECNHAACLDGNDGILSINGTGSVIYARCGDKSVKLGGWGFALDELPSGAWFGRKALEGVLRSLEGDHESRSCGDAYRQRFGKADQRMIIDELYRAPSIQKKLGEYAPVLTDALAADCPFATKAVKSSIEQLVSLFRQAARQTGMVSKITLCGSGGLWDKWQDFATLVEYTATEQHLELELVKPIQPLHLGPLILHARSCPDAQRTLQTFDTQDF
ncbi:MAG TPA: hypothetical protein DCG57_03935 [Candidatus Riflebacteria bacterium]|nr:hypothetical protein [Candidatus Riflebacteria bacterium]